MWILSKPNFPIVPEIHGTKPDGEAFFKDLLKHIEGGEFRFAFEEKDYYTVPEKSASDNEELKEYQKYCKKYLKQKITYSLGEETFTITAEQLDKLMKDDRSGKADETAVGEYVVSLAEKYDNIGAERNFTSLSGREISVAGGTYGWEINQDEEKAQLVKDINSHKDVTREPVFSEKGYGEYSRALGDTYIDVDMSSCRTSEILYKGRAYISVQTVLQDARLPEQLPISVPTTS